MRLGFARKDITPDFPVPLAGYYQPGRISQDVHDKLYARSLYFEDQKNGPLALLQLDLLELDNTVLEKIYTELNKTLPELKKNRILVCAAHTHSGFGGIYDTEQGINHELIPLMGEHNPDLVKLVVDKSVEAIVEAGKNCIETTVRINRGKVEKLGTNRRNVDLSCDNSLFIMEFYRIDRKKILLYNLCCHATVLNKENTLLSADFPGAVAGKLEEIPGGYDMVVFINGSAGDMSTRFTRQDSNFEECNRYANIIIEALEGVKKGVFLPLEKADLQYHAVSLKKAMPPDAQKARENLQNAVKNLEELQSQNADTAVLRKAASLIEGAQMSLLKLNVEDTAESAGSIDFETGILKINNTTIVCSPLELFSTLALSIKEKKDVECFGYANCLKGYLADDDAWTQLDYEALSSDFMRGEGERYIELVTALV